MLTALPLRPNTELFLRKHSRQVQVAGVAGLALIWCAFLIAARTVWTRSFDYTFLVWNLALAAAPLFFSLIFSALRALHLRLIAGACWLLFFPNSAYIVTDLLHLRAITTGPMWLDILLLVSCAAVGLLMGYTSLGLIHNQLLRMGGNFLGWAMALIALFLAGFGIYLGRFLRWRSIDILANPLPLLGDIAERIFNPLAHYRAWGVTVGFGAFLILGYLGFRIVSGATAHTARTR